MRLGIVSFILMSVVGVFTVGCGNDHYFSESYMDHSPTPIRRARVGVYVEDNYPCEGSYSARRFHGAYRSHRHPHYPGGSQVNQQVSQEIIQQHQNINSHNRNQYNNYYYQQGHAGGGHGGHGPGGNQGHVHQGGGHPGHPHPGPGRGNVANASNNAGNNHNAQAKEKARQAQINSDRALAERLQAEEYQRAHRDAQIASDRAMALRLQEEENAKAQSVQHRDAPPAYTPSPAMDDARAKQINADHLLAEQLQAEENLKASR